MLKLILLLSFCFYSIYASFNFKASDLDFPGRPLWKETSLAACDLHKEFVPNRHQNVLFCHRYRIYYEWVNLEVLSVNPPIVKYPKFLPSKLTTRFLNYTRTLRIGRLAVKGVNSTNDIVDLSEARVINGAFVQHNKACETTQLYNYAQHRLTSFDLSRADKFQVLRFESEHHHIPHYDFLRRHHDLNKRGNRMASLTQFSLTNESLCIRKQATHIFG
ncbi:Fe2OG dioxygenase domain-containing protein [Aphelenchoides bicaudatus]|nr:Fe2OG dioxygenase domain-containing protein [Aphelenchoides bicaudatus]